MPQSPKTLGFAQTTPTIKSEMDAKSLSAASTPNNNTIFSFPSIPSQEDMSSKANNIQYNSQAAYRHQEGKQLDVNDVNVNVNVVASCASSSASSHETVSISSNYLSSDSSSTNNTDTQSSKLNVINVCDGSDKTKPKKDGIILTDAQTDASSTAVAGFYDSMKMEGNGDTTTAIIYETIVIENPPMTTPQNQ